MPVQLSGGDPERQGEGKDCQPLEACPTVEFQEVRTPSGPGWVLRVRTPCTCSKPFSVPIGTLSCRFPLRALSLPGGTGSVCGWLSKSDGSKTAFSFRPLTCRILERRIGFDPWMNSYPSWRRLFFLSHLEVGELVRKDFFGIETFPIFCLEFIC